MTSDARHNYQRRLLLRHYTSLLEPAESKEYQGDVFKTAVTLLGSLITIPYVAYQLITYDKKSHKRHIGLRNGLIVQVFFTIMNYRYSRQYFKFEE